MTNLDENGIDTRLKLGLVAIYIIFVILPTVFDMIEERADKYHENLTFLFTKVIGLLIGLLKFGPEFADEVGEYNQNRNVGFAIGFLFAYSGMAFYWLYCEIFIVSPMLSKYRSEMMKI